MNEAGGRPGRDAGLRDAAGPSAGRSLAYRLSTTAQHSTASIPGRWLATQRCEIVLSCFNVTAYRSHGNRGVRGLDLRRSCDTLAI